MTDGESHSGGDRSDAAYSGAESIYTLLERPAWMRDAACREHPELTWFPERGQDIRAARAVCAGCLVRPECSEYGRRERYGVWGGVSISDRKSRRSKSAAA